jgi:hypothetical protein
MHTGIKARLHGTQCLRAAFVVRILSQVYALLWVCFRSTEELEF